ncbi:MAG: RHS repeat-associated core domain-containing protein, partial [Candidatus Bathyarchaeia archaeon]
STKALTDANQNTQASYKYDAWGNTLQTSGTITNPYLYVGELGYYADGDSGMYLLTQRWYNSVVGRFVVRDLVKAEINSYQYAIGTPTGNVDPAGLWCLKIRWPPFVGKRVIACIGTTCYREKDCPKKEKPGIEYAKNAMGLLLCGNAQLIGDTLLKVVDTIEGAQIINQTFSMGGNCYNFANRLCQYLRDPCGVIEFADVQRDCLDCCHDLILSL